MHILKTFDRTTDFSTSNLNMQLNVRIQAERHGLTILFMCRLRQTLNFPSAYSFAIVNTEAVHCVQKSPTVMETLFH